MKENKMKNLNKTVHNRIDVSSLAQEIWKTADLELKREIAYKLVESIGCSDQKRAKFNLAIQKGNVNKIDFLVSDLTHAGFGNQVIR
jgi:hypothetical protein